MAITKKLKIISLAVVLGSLCCFSFWIGPGLGIIVLICIGLSFAIWSAVTRLSKKWKIAIYVVWVGILGFLFLNPISLWVIAGSIRINIMESTLCKPSVYTPVGETLALYCQSYPLLQPFFEPASEYERLLNHAWLPEELNNAVPRKGRGSFSHDFAGIEMGGGFHHFGYQLQLDTDASSSATNVWQLYMYSEMPPKRHLKTFHLDAGQQITPDELLSNLVSRYDACIQGKAYSRYDKEDAWKGKIGILVRFNRIAEARVVCKEMREAMPDESWPTLTVALIMAEEESFERAEQMMLQWVEKHYAYRWLAHFYQLSGKPDKADETMRHRAPSGERYNRQWYSPYENDRFDIERLLQRPVSRRLPEE